MKAGIKRWLPAAMLLAALAAAVLLSCAARRSPSEGGVPEYVFTYAENQAADYPTALSAVRFSELVYERTGGRIKINVYTDAELGDEPSVLEQLQYGGIDFARMSVMTMADEVPMLNVLQLPYLYEDSAHMWRVLDGAIGEEFLAGLEGSGVVGLSWYDAGARNFYNRLGPIETLEDLAGLRIRVAESSMMYEMVRALGAEPVTVAYSEVYSGLETATLDGAENNWPSYRSMAHWEVAPYITLDAHNRIPELQLCAQSTWERLSEEDRAILRECAAESSRYERELWEQASAEAQRAIGSQCVVTELAEEELARFRAAVQPIYEKYGAGYQNLIHRIQQLGGS